MATRSSGCARFLRTDSSRDHGRTHPVDTCTRLHSSRMDCYCIVPYVPVPVHVYCNTPWNTQEVLHVVPQPCYLVPQHGYLCMHMYGTQGDMQHGTHVVGTRAECSTSVLRNRGFMGSRNKFSCLQPGNTACVNSASHSTETGKLDTFPRSLVTWQNVGSACCICVAVVARGGRWMDS